MTKTGKSSIPRTGRKSKAPKPQAPLTTLRDPNSTDPDPKVQFKVEKVVEDDKKVKPKQVFENYTEPDKAKASTGGKKKAGRPKGSKNKDKK